MMCGLMAVLLAGLALACAGCGGAAAPPPTGTVITQGPPASALIKPAVCGYLKQAPYTASEIQTLKVSCAKAASTIKTFLRDGLHARGAWRVAGRSPAPKHAVPAGTEITASIRMRSTRIPDALITFLLGGKPRDHRAPNPFFGAAAGDEHQIR